MDKDLPFVLVALDKEELGRFETYGDAYDFWNNIKRAEIVDKSN